MPPLCHIRLRKVEASKVTRAFFDLGTLIIQQPMDLSISKKYYRRKVSRKDTTSLTLLYRERKKKDRSMYKEKGIGVLKTFETPALWKWTRVILKYFISSNEILFYLSPFRSYSLSQLRGTPCIHTYTSLYVRVTKQREGFSSCNAREQKQPAFGKLDIGVGLLSISLSLFLALWPGFKAPKRRFEHVQWTTKPRFPSPHTVSAFAIAWNSRPRRAVRDRYSTPSAGCGQTILNAPR